MAGIGWRLERLIDQGVLGTAAAYSTGAAVTALPWVLTTIVLMTLPAVIGRNGAESGVTAAVVNAAYAVALLVAGPVQIVISRHTADRLYERRFRAIAAPFRLGLSATFLACTVPAAVVILALGFPPRAAVWGAALSAAVGGEWTALSVGNGLCSPTMVLGAVVAGAVVSFGAAALLVALTGLGMSGYVFGLILGQILTLVLMLFGIFRALPEGDDETSRILPAFRDYAPLAGAGFAFNASLWVDKLIVLWIQGGERGSVHAQASTLAWFSTVPCLAWVFVEVETRFHRRYRDFFRSLEGGASLAELRKGVRGLVAESARMLRGAILVQVAVIASLQFAAARVARWLRLPHEAILPYRFLLFGAGAEAVGLLGLILLYYFDLRREALLAAVGLLVAVTVCTLAASAWGLEPSLGVTAGCLIGAVHTWRLVFVGVSRVLELTLLGQPFGVEGRGRSRLRARPSA